MLPFDKDFLLRVAPKFSGAKAIAQARIVDAIAGPFGRMLEDAGLGTVLRIAHFTAQVTHESAGLRTTEEFADGSAYEGRADLGNTEPGDGRRYKGRGLLQLTGRSNYRAAGRALALPLEDEPALAADPVTSLRIAIFYWVSHGINAAADRDDLIGVTRLVNGRLNGLDDRRVYVRRAKAALATMQGIAAAT